MKLRNFTLSFLSIIILLFPGSIIYFPIHEVNAQTTQIPTWVKTNAKWWSQGLIGDDQFILDIQYMSQNGIIKIPIIQPTSSLTLKTNHIPAWVKTNAGWWSSGQISDEEFASGIQYLISNAIISVGSLHSNNKQITNVQQQTSTVNPSPQGISVVVGNGSTSTSSGSVTGPPCKIPSIDDLSNQIISPSSTFGTLSGHVPPPVKKGLVNSTSSLPPTFLLHMELTFKIRNIDSFEQCLSAIHKTNSPYYRHFLTNQTVESYVPTPGEKLSLTNYLEAHGFNVTDGFSPLTLQMTAPVSAVESLFDVKEDIYKSGNQSSFYGPATDPIIPSNYASVIESIWGLDNYTTIRPAVSPSNCAGPFCPQGIQVGYGLSTLFSNGFNGAGQTVAIVDDPGDPDPQTAINTFDTQFGLPATTLNIIQLSGQGGFSPSWASEAAMDIEAVHTVAPGANIVLVYVHTNNLLDGDDFIATSQIFNKNQISGGIVSNSWGYQCGGGPCADTSSSGFPYSTVIGSTDSRLAFDAAEGLTILFASGDQGSAPDGNNIGTEWPASDSNVLAVGATDLSLSGCSSTTCSGYGSEDGASISGGGFSGKITEPSWQVPVLGTNSGRGIPDVSMMGGSPDFWVFSTLSDHCGNNKQPPGSGWFACAGTSLSTPLWAGYLAIVKQIEGGKSIGNIAPEMYTMGTATTANFFHDITSGCNGPAQAPKIFCAGPGWDAVTGFGTPASDLAWALAIPNPSELVSGNINGNCEKIAGTWNGINTCRVANLIIPKGYSLTIDPGVTLEVSGGTLEVKGTIANNGLITTNSDGFLTIDTGVSINNSGTITNSGTIVNNGNINNCSDFIYPTITNLGNIINNMQITNCGFINNSGEINNFGTLTSSGNITNAIGSTIVNSGIIDTNDYFYNYGNAIFNTGAINNGCYESITSKNGNYIPVSVNYIFVNPAGASPNQVVNLQCSLTPIGSLPGSQPGATNAGNGVPPCANHRHLYQATLTPQEESGLPRPSSITPC